MKTKMRYHSAPARMDYDKKKIESNKEAQDVEKMESSHVSSW